MFLFCLFQSAESLVSTHESASTKNVFFLRFEEVQCFMNIHRQKLNLTDSTWLDLTKMFADKKAVVAKYEMTAVHYFWFTFELVFTLNQNKGFFLPCPKVLTSLIPLDDHKVQCRWQSTKPSSHLSSKGFAFWKKSFGDHLNDKRQYFESNKLLWHPNDTDCHLQPFFSVSLSSFASGSLKTLVHEKTCKFFQFHGPNRRRNKTSLPKYVDRKNLCLRERVCLPDGRKSASEMWPSGFEWYDLEFHSRLTRAAQERT